MLAYNVDLYVIMHAPHAWTAPAYVYGASTQLTPPEDLSAPLTPEQITRLQEINGTLMYYIRAIAEGTGATAKAVTHLLNYCATHPDAVIRYYASDMCLLIHSDASYLSERKSKSRSAGCCFFLSKITIRWLLLPQPPPRRPDSDPRSRWNAASRQRGSNIWEVRGHRHRDRRGS
jgi:hypothetical protein